MNVAFSSVRYATALQIVLISSAFLLTQLYPEGSSEQFLWLKGKISFY